MRIGLICAIEEESKHILQEMKVEKEIVKLRTCFYLGWYLGHEVVFVIGGMGKVSSAVCTQVLIDSFGVELILFSGIAGGLHPELLVGDTVIGVETFYHDVDRAGEGIKLDTIDSIFRNRFTVDKRLIAQVKEGLTDRVYPLPSYLKKRRKGKELEIVFGRILTGDQVITSKDKVLELSERFAGHCVEMEGAAVAQTCVMNELPFLLIRTISDLADEDALQTARDSMDSVVQVNYLILQDILKILQ